jgi:hypothetical protein
MQPTTANALRTERDRWIWDRRVYNNIRHSKGVVGGADRVVAGGAGRDAMTGGREETLWQVVWQGNFESDLIGRWPLVVLAAVRVTGLTYDRAGWPQLGWAAGRLRGPARSRGPYRGRRAASGEAEPQSNKRRTMENMV